MDYKGFIVAENGEGKILYTDIAEREIPHPEYYGELPFVADYAAEEQFYGETNNFRLVEDGEKKGTRKTVYRSADNIAEVVVTRKMHLGVLSQTTEIRNIGTKRLCVKKLFNRFAGICPNALTGDYLRDIEIGVMRGEWGGEGQLFWEDAQSLGLYRATGHKTSYTAQLVSPASYTTRKFAPLLFFREKKSGTVWAIQHLPDGPYVLEIGLTDAENVQGSYYNAACGAGDSERQGFRIYLARGKRYRCSESLFTCAPDFEGAVSRLTAYRRSKLRIKPAAPLMFNDYMNSLWCKLDEEECLSLLDVAQKLGVEGYCFDDGWYRAKDVHGATGLGDWIPCDSRFGGHTFAGMVEEITSRGLVAGLWTELEVCSSLSEACKLPKSWFLTNEGERVYRCGRYYFNFAKKEVREYLLGRVRALYNLGIRYIKNDYNGHPGCGVDWRNASAYAGLEQHCRAVHTFYEQLGKEFPDLVLESCASGAMRADGRTMKNFHTQSVSDCEEYYKLPSIIGGTLLGLLPEQVSVWVYPYPRIFWEMNGESYLTQKYRAAQADGRETAFNLINGFMGNILLSGKINRADQYNLELISRGLALYKEWRAFIGSSEPVYPLGLAHLTDEVAPIALGLKKGKKLLLAVWRREGEACVRVPVKGLCGGKEIFPLHDCAFEINEETFCAVLPNCNQAALFELEIK